MNASAALRASFYGPAGPLGPSPADLLRARRRATVADVEALGKRQTIVPVDYANYSSQCRKIKEEAGEESIFDVEPMPEPPSVLDQIGRMITIWPYRDANWVIAILFIVGSIVFTVNGFFGLLPLLDPATALPAEALYVVPVLNILGAAHFLTGGTLSLVASWNADKGEYEPVDIMTEGGVTKTYKPALLGSRAWSWRPSAADLRALIRTPPFLSSLVQSFGGLILTVSVVSGWPGIISPEDIFSMQLFLFGPLTIGGFLFFFANMSLLIWMQDRWYKPKWGEAGWQSAFWSSVGSFNFAYTGITLFTGDFLTSSIASFIGSWTFLLGAVIQWYDLMAFHPDAWAA
ncbi:hypothetical protein GGS23DRAFT_551800 [Durotheca rogersii]|uniref:uncharacterized protein n=1 Tax=Durotheca rogersii TaxID=419775 RepID=UPI00221FCEFC|nr:uncharacterized protein GGS23DRAFT_551800 [Durotheca rogersii]KAI5866742.1 hypothetical protein GGS23DRAFT_551800 [Durotheca rogersii]